MTESSNAQTARPAVGGKKQPGEMGGWARYYDFVMVLLTLGREKRLRQMTVRWSQLTPGERVLEIGSGTGTLSLAAKARVGSSGEVCGVDIAPEMVAVARGKATRRGVDVSFQEGSIASIPHPDSRFDVVMCSFMIFHMPEDVRRKGLAEIHRVLRPGGRLCIIDAASLDKLIPELQEKSFAEIETEATKFVPLGIWFLRGKVEKG